LLGQFCLFVYSKFLMEILTQRPRLRYMEERAPYVYEEERFYPSDTRSYPYANVTASSAPVYDLSSRSQHDQGLNHDQAEEEWIVVRVTPRPKAPGPLPCCMFCRRPPPARRPIGQPRGGRLRGNEFRLWISNVLIFARRPDRGLHRQRRRASAPRHRWRRSSRRPKVTPPREAVPRRTTPF
jgi:hypothetical protein